MARTRRNARSPLALFAIVTLSAACSGSGTVARRPAATAPRDTATAPAAYRGVGPPPIDPKDIYAADRAGMLSPVVRNVPYRIYVPNSGGDTVDVIDPATFKVVATYHTGLDPQHVVPAYDLKTLYATNDLANTLTPIDPMTGEPAAPAIPVDDPYNLYFTPDGAFAIVVAEARQHLDFRDPHTFRLEHRLSVDCAGVDHIDFSADGTYFIATCEFSSKLVKVDVRSQTVLGYLTVSGSPQDIKLDPAGQIFYVADMLRGGVHLIDAATFTEVGFVGTGRDAHGLYPSRDGRDLYVSNRKSGTISVVNFATRQVVATWTIPGGGSPDMGNVSPDGSVLWLSGRNNGVVYAISTVDGHLLARIPVGPSPHGLCVWPQPGRYSLGHTGILR